MTLDWKLVGVMEAQSYWFVALPDKRLITLHRVYSSRNIFQLRYQVPHFTDTALTICIDAKNFDEAKQKAAIALRETLENGMLELDKLEEIE